MHDMTRLAVNALRVCAAVTLALALSSCGLFGSDKPPAPKKSPLQEIEIKPAPGDARINLLITASPLINPQPDGGAAPIILRLYQLSGQVPFVQANFRQLWEHDAQTLGPTLLHKSQFIVQPGGVQQGVVPLAKGTMLLAVTAGFRDYEHAKWRAIVALHGQKQVKLKVVLETRSVGLASPELGQFADQAPQASVAAADGKVDGGGSRADGAAGSPAAATNDAKQAAATGQPSARTPESKDAKRPSSARQSADGPTPNGPQKPAENGRQVYLQVGAFSSRDNAQQLLQRLHGMGIEHAVVESQRSNGTTLHRVRVGPFATTDRRHAVHQRLVAQGFPVIRIQQQAPP